MVYVSPLLRTSALLYAGRVRSVEVATRSSTIVQSPNQMVLVTEPFQAILNLVVEGKCSLVCWRAVRLACIELLDYYLSASTSGMATSPTAKKSKFNISYGDGDGGSKGVEESKGEGKHFC